mgnify:CR=1 FL=1
MGSKYKFVAKDTPGPGQYEGSASLTQRKTATVKISLEKRKDPWAEKMQDQPGPGNYEGFKSSFGQNKGPSMGSKYRQETNLVPGPGQYDGDISKVKASGGQTRMTRA